MEENAALYGAIENLKRAVGADGELKALLNALAAAQGDRAVVKSSVCAVDEKWVEAVERGLGFIENAIKEERRFIRSDGDVLPIEKIKRASKESVQHLARHSDLINGQKSGDEVVPDKLLSVERLNDYATYENRFLYMLLCMLKEFVERKYAQILKSSVYRGEFTSRKSVRVGGRRLEIDVRVSDENAGDELLNGNILGRIEQLRQSVEFCLRTPLMVEVSKADAIHSGLTKTNVLRMDKNFKQAVELYDFLLAYDGDGFTSRSGEREIQIDEAAGRDFALPAILCAFIAYERGMGLEKSFKESYENAERARLEEQRAAVEKGVAGAGGAEKYIRLVSERNARLEDAAKQLAPAREEIARLNARLEALNAECEGLKVKIAELGAEVESGKAAAENAENAAERAKEELLKERGEKDILLARLTAAREREGLVSAEEFTSEEDFGALERDYETLGKLVRRKWKGVKKALRGEFYADLKSSLFVKKKTGKVADDE